jgi:glycosyltransferase involved in cell wall biosynthesis
VSERKKVLIITYYWPPSGGVTVQRCLKFTKFLRDFGWEPIVYAPENAQYIYFDETNFKDVPKDIKILKHPIIEPFNLFKKLSGRKKDDGTNPVYARGKKVKFIDGLAIWIRGNFFIPDARCLWIKPSVRFLSDYLKNHKVDAILTDGPPHTNTVIGCKLSKKFNIPWLADFQDPWTQVDYYKMIKLTAWADRKHRKMEQEVFRTAKKITIASPTWARDLESIGAKNVDTILWGFDDDDFPKEKPAAYNEFTISHAGLLGYDRNPDVFLRVLGDLKKADPEFGKNLKLRFAGVVDFTVKERIASYGLSENFIELGNIPRPQALDLTLKAHVLLLPLNIADNAKGRIPGKLFECMRSGNRILCLGPKGSDVENILNKSNTGDSYEYNDYSGIKKFILDYYNRFKNGELTHLINDISEYSVKNQTSKIAKYLDDIT